MTRAPRPRVDPGRRAQPTRRPAAGALPPTARGALLACALAATTATATATATPPVAQAPSKAPAASPAASGDPALSPAGASAAAPSPSPSPSPSVGAAAASVSSAGLDLLETEEPRAFGYHVGDRVERRFRLRVPAPWRLDPDSLPGAGRRGRALELREARWEPPGPLDGEVHRLTLRYQVFAAPPQVQVLELPPVRLRFDAAGREHTLRLDAWPLAVGPLAPPEAPMRSGLGDWRPPARAPLEDTAAIEARLLLWAALALLALGWLAVVYGLAPRWAARRLPFGRAWPALRGLPDALPAEAERQACRALHAALNATAGEAVFADGLDRFLARAPRYAAQRAALQAFFSRSQALFFGEVGTEAAGDGRALRQLARALRDLERGAA